MRPFVKIIYRLLFLALYSHSVMIKLAIYSLSFQCIYAFLSYRSFQNTYHFIVEPMQFLVKSVALRQKKLF